MSDPTADEIRLDLTDLYLRRCKEEYEELSDIWRDIERKAQGTVAIAGIFGFMYFRAVESGGGMVAVLFTAVCVGLLGLSALFSVACLLARRVPTPPKSEDLVTLVHGAISLQDEASLRARAQLVRTDYAVLWNNVTSGLREANEIKYRWLKFSQQLLAATIAVIVFATIILNAIQR